MLLILLHLVVGMWLPGGEWIGIWTQTNASSQAKQLLENRSNIVTTLTVSRVPDVYDQQTCFSDSGVDTCTVSTAVADRVNTILWLALPWRHPNEMRPFLYTINEGIVTLAYLDEWYQWEEKV